MGEAEARFAAGEHDAAARLWGRTTGAGPSFEETALRCVDAGATSALQAFLLARLDALGPDDRAQARDDHAPVCRWRPGLALACMDALVDALTLVFCGPSVSATSYALGEPGATSAGCLIASNAVCRVMSTLACCSAPCKRCDRSNRSCSDLQVQAHLAMAARFPFHFQATMVATWLVELLLDQINRALLEDTPEARAAVDDYTARLRAFLKAGHVAHGSFCRLAFVM